MSGTTACLTLLHDSLQFLLSCRENKGLHKTLLGSSDIYFLMCSFHCHRSDSVTTLGGWITSTRCSRNLLQQHFFFLLSSPIFSFLLKHIYADDANNRKEGQSFVLGYQHTESGLTLFLFQGPGLSCNRIQVGFWATRPHVTER